MRATVEVVSGGDRLFEVVYAVDASALKEAVLERVACALKGAEGDATVIIEILLA